MATSYGIGRSGIVALKVAEMICCDVAGTKDVELFDINRMTLTGIKDERRVMMLAAWKEKGGAKVSVSFLLQFQLKKMRVGAELFSHDWVLSDTGKIVYTPCSLSACEAFELHFSNPHFGLESMADTEKFESYRKWLSALR